jgi:hypothetical protein
MASEPAEVAKVSCPPRSSRAANAKALVATVGDSTMQRVFQWKEPTILGFSEIQDSGECLLFVRWSALPAAIFPTTPDVVRGVREIVSGGEVRVCVESPSLLATTSGAEEVGFFLWRLVSFF